MESRGPYRLLIVEDDAKLAELVREFLEANGFEVQVEPRGDHAVARIIKDDPHLVVLDLMLPGLDGLSVCKKVRPAYEGAILMLTARGDEIDEVVGLELGADDYMAKPVRPRLLLARIHTLLRRLGSASGAADEATPEATETRPRRLEHGPLTVDPTARAVSMEGRPVELTTAEFDLLYYLACHPGEVLTRERIYSELRGIEYDGLDRSMDLRIARLRKKLGDDGKQPRIIKSVRGAGYLLAVSS